MLFTMGVSLYTSRVNLSVLGIEDNGIYQVVGGVVTMFAFLNNALSGATSRFLTYELGRDNKEGLKQTFATALIIHIIVAGIILILSETVGLWFLENKLVIPEERMLAARVVFQLSVISCMINITQVPYNASIISHEKMDAFAYMSILDVSLKLLVCFLLYITPFDRLISYGVLMLLVITILQFTYRFYCKKHFEECTFKFYWNPKTMKPMLGYSGWDLFGHFGVMARTQGVNMVMNMFFGPAINAACGFSTTVGNAIEGFATNFLTAIRPPIVKAFAMNDFRQMENLMINASKYAFALMLFLSTPFFFESTYILELWLKTPPKYTDIFCVLELSYSLVNVLFLSVMFGVSATGKVRFTSIVNGSLCFIVLPISYAFLLMGYSPVTPFVVKISLWVFLAMANLYSLKKTVDSFDIPYFFSKAVYPSIKMAIITFAITVLVRYLIPTDGFLQFFITGVTSSATVAVCLYMFILTNEHRQKIKSKILSNLHINK